MEFGIAVRSMGPQSAPALLLGCVKAAERAGLADVWVQDHLAIAPNEAEGSGGRYLDPLTTLAYLAAATTRIGLGTGVLNLPYRAPLPTAKAVATVQELSGGRLRLGVGVGWMKSEFRALGVPRSQRGRRSDEVLAFLHRCFGADEVEAHGQRFLFLPRPELPPIFVGGAPPHALERTVAYGDGWLPMGADPAALAPAVVELHERAAKAGKRAPQVKLMTSLALSDPPQAHAQVTAFAEIGVTSIVHAARYDRLDEFERAADALASCVASFR